jgi:uncharacterized membrane protein (UPF0127 family)
VIVGLFAAGAAISGSPSSGRAPLIKISILYRTGNESSYTVFHATTEPQWTEGLMNYTFGNCTVNRTSVSGSCADEVVGELFSFNNVTNTCFWMKNTPEPLVQAWLSENGTVSYIYDGVPYSTDVICANGSAVLELGKNLGIPLQVGDLARAG